MEKKPNIEITLDGARAYVRTTNIILKTYHKIIDEGNVVIEISKDRTMFRRIWETTHGQKSATYWMVLRDEKIGHRNSIIISKAQFNFLCKRCWKNSTVTLKEDMLWKVRTLMTDQPRFPKGTAFVVIHNQSPTTLCCRMVNTAPYEDIVLPITDILWQS